MPKQDLHPEVSLEQEFERWLARARGWIIANVTLILLVVVASAIVVAAVGFSVNARKSSRLSILRTLSEAEAAARKAGSQSEEEGRGAINAVLEDLVDAGERAEGTDLHAYALMAAANIHYDNAEYETALGLYEQVARKHADNYLSRPARLGMAASLEALDRWADARKEYEGIVADSPETFYAVRAADRLEALAAPPVSPPAPASMPAEESTDS